jgi:carboxyl-terminal processing protease
MPIDACLVPGTSVGYLFLPTLLDRTVADQTRAALRRLTADGPLAGLVIDNRVNGGGSGEVAKAMLGLFTRGRQGSYLSRAGREPLDLAPEDVGGSQSVPLVVLVGGDTVSYAEIFSGVLRAAGRARLVGERTRGNVEQLHRYEFEDGSRAWIASATFEPPGESAGAWEARGLVPDLVVPARWELFTEATDPGLAKAVELLRRGPGAPAPRP